MLGLAFKMTWRDWRAGELRLLLLVLAVAVAALSATGFFVERLRLGMTQNAHEMLGGDLAIESDHPLPVYWRQQALKQGLQVAQVMTFPSMAISPAGQAKLVSLKAVEASYPLRGHLKVWNDEREQTVIDRPAHGMAWVDPALAQALSLHEGATIRLGDAQFMVAHWIAQEPDRGLGFASLAPRVMIVLPDVEATHLVQDGSRITYRLLLAGSSFAVQAMHQWAKTELEHQQMRGVHIGIRIETLESGRPEMQTMLDRTGKFLSLVALLAAMLAAVAIAVASRRFMLRHLDSCAMLRCLGLTQAQVLGVFLCEFLLLGVIGSTIGAALGYGAHFVLLRALGTWVGQDLPVAGLTTIAHAGLAGFLLLLGFALPPLLQLRNVPHNRVLRREQTPPQVATVLTYVLGLVMFAGLLMWQTGDVKLGALLGGGFLASTLLFSAIAWCALRALRLADLVKLPASWRFALTAIRRRTMPSVLQTVALALGLFALLLLSVVRTDLLAAWRGAIPANAPNQFVINIQPDQKDDIARRVQAFGQPQLYPMIRGRLIEVNGISARTRSAQDGNNAERAQRLLNREFNLSTMPELPEGNRIVAGRWYADDVPEASVEEGIAKALNLHLGDRLTFDVAGQTVTAPITSVRRLDWSSMRVNFFVIVNPRAMQDMPQTWITSFHLPHAHADFIRELSNAYPNLTVFDVGAIMQMAQEMMDRVVAAIEFLFLFTMAAGILVLYAVLLASQELRMKESALLRALGASRSELTRAQWIEFALLGSLAGLLAATAAQVFGWVLARYVFEFGWVMHARVWLIGAGGGAICAVLGAWTVLRTILSRPPLASLREW